MCHERRGCETKERAYTGVRLGIGDKEASGERRDERRKEVDVERQGSRGRQGLRLLATSIIPASFFLPTRQCLSSLSRAPQAMLTVVKVTTRLKTSATFFHLSTERKYTRLCPFWLCVLFFLFRDILGYVLKCVALLFML